MEGTTKGTTAKSRRRRNGTRSLSGSKSLSLCFKPVVMDGASVEPPQPAFAYVPVESLPLPPFPPRVVSFDVKDEKKKGTQRRLSRVIKAVLFETSLVKKAIKRKLRQRSTDNYLQPKPEKSIANEFPERYESLEDEDMRNASNLSSSLRYPSSVASAMLSPYPLCRSERNVVQSFQPRAKGVIATEQGKGYFGPNAGLSLLLMSLLILTFWGKICAIFCTSTWLFFIPWWSIKQKRSEETVELPPELDSELCRKKVIMEGLLERNRSRG